MATTFYYPEGPLGPVCDIVVDDVVAPRILVDEGDDRVTTYGPIDWDETERVIGTSLPAIIQRRCRQRVLPDGKIEYYDCVDDLTAQIVPPPGYPLIEPQYNWPVKSVEPWGLDDDFEPLTITPEACFPHDPDINIIPVKFYSADGTFVEKTQIEKSSPVTFPVDSISGYDIVSGSINATFVETGGGNVVLRATGSGTGNIGLEFEWDDDPNAHGTATSSVSVGNITFNQSGSKGKQTATINVTAGTDYPVTIVGGTGYGGKSVSPGSLCFFDLHETDCNALLKITSSTSQDAVLSSGAWSDDGNAYGVWVNPEVCTLPYITQQVTYFVDIPETDTYSITGGADDFFNVYLNDSATPIIGGQSGIFKEEHEIYHTGSYTPPYSATTTLQAGTLKIVVSATNSDAGFQDGNGDPVGNAFVWNMNPGGWYIKICKGGVCEVPQSINWYPVSLGSSWSTLMNTYAVYPSQTEELASTTHSATYYINIPAVDTYTITYAGDNEIELLWDGVQVAQLTGDVASHYNTDHTVSLPSVSKGQHTLTMNTSNVPNASTSGLWSDNPAGAAWKLEDSNGNIIKTSRNLVTSGGGNLIWHTRMATGYKYVEV